MWLSKSESHEVLHPECVAITKSKLVVTCRDEDRVVHCGLIHVNAVEAQQQPRGDVRHSRVMLMPNDDPSAGTLNVSIDFPVWYAGEISIFASSGGPE